MDISSKFSLEFCPQVPSFSCLLHRLVLASMLAWTLHMLTVDHCDCFSLPAQLIYSKLKLDIALFCFYASIISVTNTLMGASCGTIPKGLDCLRYATEWVGTLRRGSSSGDTGYWWCSLGSGFCSSAFSPVLAWLV